MPESPISTTSTPEHRRALTFWTFAALYGVFMAAAAAPSPLYRVYASRWHFSAFTLTVVFSVYAVGLLAALLVTGRLSDHLGRRSVVLGAVAVEVAAMACFITADSTAWLLVGRAVQGIATGCAIGALSAGIIELSDAVPTGLAPMITSSAPVLGLAAGALGSSALVEYGPAPLRLVYWVIVAALGLGGVLTALLPEPGQRRQGALRSLKPIASVPPYARASFVKVLPSVVALWALSGFVLSLAPGLAGQIEASPNLLWGGTAVFCFTISGGVAVIVLRRLQSHHAMLIGCLGLLVGAVTILAGVAATEIGPFLIGNVIAGAGFGLAFLGGIRIISEVAAAHERAGTLAAFYAVSYLAFSVPIVAAGLAETHFSAHTVALAFSAGVALLAAIGAAAGLSERNHQTVVTR